MSDIDYGPQAEAVHAIEARFETLSKDEKQKLYELRDDAFWTAWNVIGVDRTNRAGLKAAQDALRDRLFGFYGARTACGAALAVLLRHTISEAEWVHYDALVRPWVLVTGELAHPDDFQDHDPRPRPAVAVESETGADELAALATMVDLFKDLDNDARHRVIRYLGNRYGVDL